MDFPAMIEDDYEGAVALAEEMLAALILLVGNGFSDEELARRWSWSVAAIRVARDAVAKAEGRAA